MTYKRAMFIFSHDDKRYFAGWNNGIVGHALWSEEIDLGRVYTSQKEADETYEILRGLGFDVEVQG
jgi:hypothetical protein